MSALNSTIAGGAVQKKIAVLVRDRQGEALRMSLGLILVDDLVDDLVDLASAVPGGQSVSTRPRSAA